MQKVVFCMCIDAWHLRITYQTALRIMHSVHKSVQGIEMACVMFKPAFDGLYWCSPTIPNEVPLATTPPPWVQGLKSLFGKVLYVCWFTSSFRTYVGFGALYLCREPDRQQSGRSKHIPVKFASNLGGCSRQCCLPSKGRSNSQN